MGNEYSQTGRSARLKRASRLKDRTTELDQRDRAEAQPESYDEWMYRTHLNTQTSTQIQFRKIQE